MKITKVINNNVVCAFNEDNKEVVIMGKGIGFKAKEGRIIDDSKIEKIFVMNSKSSVEKFKQLLENLPMEHFNVSNEIIAYAKEILGVKINPNIYITLTDHINFAVYRFKNGIQFSNPLLWEVRQFYKSEYLIGEYAVNLIEKKLGVKMNKDEAANIALHIVNAEYNTEMKDAMRFTNLIADILKIVEEFYEIKLDENNIHYSRFITHLKFLCQRLFSNELLESNEDDLAEMIISSYPREYKCSLKIKDYIEGEYQHNISQEELAYLTVYIKRICAFSECV
ncbi:MAG: PRD domain-containing protein [Clostridium sp.]|nr:PRD domain-containing protein [Clostridium sp.]MDU7083064.1 PRD domain-containing protein [Clostridium sp.]